MITKKVNNLIEALSKHEDSSALGILERLGTNSENESVREATAKALVRKNTHESLKIVLISKGKGIHDLNANVAINTINEIIELKDKTEAIKILEDTANLHSDEEVRATAFSVKSLIEYSKF